MCVCGPGSSGVSVSAAEPFSPPAAPRAGSERLITKTSSSNLQDILRLLTLWFNYGAAPDVEAALQEGFSHVSIDTWLAVIPQVHRCSQAPTQT